MLLVRLDPNSSDDQRDVDPARPRGPRFPAYGHRPRSTVPTRAAAPSLLIKTLKQHVFPQLRVNHIVDVNFSGFIALVNQIHCVYSDIDHRYYNNTAYTGYSSINIQPGYQRLCGFRALQFVRFRHTDSDLVRNARQQDFIRWAKDQYGVDNLVANRDSLLRTFGKYTRTDHNLRTTDGLLNLFQLVAFSAGHTIKQIKFAASQQPVRPGHPGGGVVPCYLTATPSSEAAEFRAFMRPTPASAVAKNAKTGDRRQAVGQDPAGRPDGRHHGRPEPGPRDRKHRHARLLPAVDRVRVLVLLEPDRQLHRRRSPAPAPTRAPTSCATRSGDGYPAYRMTLVDQPGAGRVLRRPGHDAGATRRCWQPDADQAVAGKKLELFANGGKLDDGRHGRRRRAPTGSRTRSPPTSRTSSWCRSQPRWRAPADRPRSARRAAAALLRSGGRAATLRRSMAPNANPSR